ncbi:MAG TPA: molybdenum ABC transporter ATP-binding protein [Gammaproteobacteria bacterium]|nr:molybdenum ABC transporter ATP-binding protein [Gammaproteobacteria bacterium]
MQVRYKKQLESFLLDVRFDMPDRGVTVLFGPSGAGKSSLLNLMAGIDDNASKITCSQFKLKQTIYDDSEKNINLKPWQRKIGVVFQDHHLFPHMTVRENILFGYKRRKSNKKINSLVDAFGITELLDHYPAYTSGGQKQRVSMVRALLSEPDLLILDEPLAALDYKSRQEIIPYIEGIAKRLSIPIIYVSHDIREVLRLAEHIVIIDQGKIVDTGNISELCINQPLLTQQEGASFILHGSIKEIIADDQLIQVNCEKKSIYFSDRNSGNNLILGQDVKILIHAKDVSLCLKPPADSSILNCIPVTIEKIEENSSGKLLVFSSIGSQTIVAAISHRSARLLNVKSGEKMYAQFKATAMIK